MNKFISCAEWPPGTVLGSVDQVTHDLHPTEAQAEGVCDLLRRHGFGGDGQVFPTRTWVSPVMRDGKHLYRPLQEGELIRDGDQRLEEDAWVEVPVVAIGETVQYDGLEYRRMVS